MIILPFYQRIYNPEAYIISLMMNSVIDDLCAFLDISRWTSIRIDELEDEIIREKLKINAVSGQLDDTFNEMLNKY